MAAGENVSALGRELGVRSKLLYQWRDTVQRGGAEALRGVGRPPAAERLERAPARSRAVMPAGVAVPDELALAQQRMAAMESFMKTLKQEEVDGRTYRDLAHAQASIGEFIEAVYNRQRLNSALDYLASAEFEA